MVRKPLRENTITSFGLYFGILFYLLKRYFPEFFKANLIEISTYVLVGLSALLIFANINHFKLLYNPIMGMLAFATVYLGVILAGTRGLSNSSPEVIEGLTRITIAVFAVWKLSSDMRNLKLEIDPFKKEERSKLVDLFYGILYPPKELLRLIKVIIYILVSFYFVFTGLNLLGSSDVNIIFLQKTERLSLNILFFGIQTPMMMASRASVSQTFSEYIKNLEWAQAALIGNSALSDSYRQVLNTNEISYDAISSNGKHLWLTVLLLIVLQAFETQITSLDLFNLDYGAILNSIIQAILDFIKQLF